MLSVGDFPSIATATLIVALVALFSATGRELQAAVPEEGPDAVDLLLACPMFYTSENESLHHG